MRSAWDKRGQTGRGGITIAHYMEQIISEIIPDHIFINMIGLAHIAVTKRQIPCESDVLPLGYVGWARIPNGEKCVLRMIYRRCSVGRCNGP